MREEVFSIGSMMVFTVCTLHRMRPAPDAPCTGCALHRMRPALDAPCTGCALHRMRPAPDAPCTGCALHRMRPAPDAPCTGCALHRMWLYMIHRMRPSFFRHFLGPFRHFLGGSLKMPVSALYSKGPNYYIMCRPRKDLSIHV